MTDQQKVDVKEKLEQYLSAKGLPWTQNPMQCPSPSHADNHHSANLYKNDGKPPRVYCPVCAKTWDIFGLSELLNGGGFRDQVADVCATLGIVEEKDHITRTDKKVNHILAPGKKVIKKKKPAPKPINPVAIPYEDRRTVYSPEKVEAMPSYKKWGTRIAGTWPYFNPAGELIGYDVRVEGGKRKIVVPIWYDGERLRADGAPVMIYNLPGIIKAIKSGGKVVFHEGAKCAQLAEILPGWTSGGWSGGGKKAQKVDLTPLVNAGIKELWYYPDRDLKTYPEKHILGGELIPWDNQPGMVSARMFRDHCTAHDIACHIIPPMETAPIDGADIEEVLAVYSPEEIAHHFNTAQPIEFPPPALPAPPETTKKPKADKPKKEKKPVYKPDPPGGINPDAFLFDILGTGDDGLTYFIGINNRHYKWKLDSIGPARLKMLMSQSEWMNMYPSAGNKWHEQALDEIILIATAIDFDPEKIKGRGAYLNENGEPYYFDGMNYTGTPSSELVHLRKAQKDIGINDTPAPAQLRQDMWEVANKLSFATTSHMIRALGWSVLAPWCGLCNCRPPILVTGDPGGGKSYISGKVIAPLSTPLRVDGSTSTPMGTLSKAGGDSIGIQIEEAEGDTKKKKENREAFLSLMRAGYDKDAPKSFKGTQDGGFRSVDIQNMFMFVSVDPTIPHAPDEDRIFRVHIHNDAQKGETQEDRIKRFQPIDREVRRLFTEKNCRAVRAYTWQNIKLILRAAEDMQSMIAAASGQSYRYCQAEALLLAAYLVVFQNVGADGFTEDKIRAFLKIFYDWSPVEHKTTATAQMTDKILQHVVRIEKYRIEFTVWQILEFLNRGFYEVDPAIVGDEEPHIERDLRPFKIALGNIGLALVGIKDHDRKCLAVMKNNNALKRLMGWGTNSYIQLQRHRLTLKSQNCNIPGQGSKPATVIDIFKEETE